MNTTNTTTKMETRFLANRVARVVFQAAALALSLHATAAQPTHAQPGDTLRPPSVPLVACDPYFSIWSPADKLTDANTVHWTGKPNRLDSIIRIDGKSFRLLGQMRDTLPALP